ncbi:MAG: hypothetical protein ACRCS8_03190 [Brevinema sp.]
MNSQKLQSIRQSEVVAKELLNSVEEEIQQVIRKTNASVAQIQEDAKTEARQHENKLLDQYRVKGEDQAKGILSALDVELKNIDQSTQSAQQQAISYIHEQMKVMYGNH